MVYPGLDLSRACFLSQAATRESQIVLVKHADKPSSNLIFGQYRKSMQIH